MAAVDGAVTPRELRRALRYYTQNAAYKARLVAGAAREELDGEAAGE